MSLIQIDVESNKSDLDALVAELETALQTVTDVTAKITAFQLTFSVTEVPETGSEVPVVTE